MKRILWPTVVVILLFPHSAWAGRFEDACGELKHDSYARDQYEYCIQAEIAADSDCEECLPMIHERPNPWVEITDNLAMPLTILGSTFINAHYGLKAQRRWANSYDLSQKLWSDAFNNGINSCNVRFNSYLEYTTARGAPPVLPEQVASLNECNGISLQDFAGFRGLAGDGFGGFGTPFGGAGYSPGFMGGMSGPYFGGGYGGGFGTGMGMGVGPGMMQAGLGLSIGIPSISIGAGVGIGGGGGIVGGGGMGIPGIGVGGGFNRRGFGMPPGIGTHGGLGGGIVPGMGGGRQGGLGFPRGGGGWQGGMNGGFGIPGIGVGGGMGVPGVGGGWNGGLNGGWNGGGYWNNTGGWRNNNNNLAWQQRRREMEDYRRFREERQRRLLEERRRAEEEWRRQQEARRKEEEKRRRRAQEERDFQEWNRRGNAQSYQEGMRGLYEDFRYSQENLQYGMGRYHGGVPWGMGNIGGSFNMGAYGRMGH